MGADSMVASTLIRDRPQAGWLRESWSQDADRVVACAEVQRVS